MSVHLMADKTCSASQISCPLTVCGAQFEGSDEPVLVAAREWSIVYLYCNTAVPHGQYDFSLTKKHLNASL